MEATTTPDQYEPSINKNGEYIDQIPNLTNGITCDCINRVHKIVIYTRTQFNAHIKTKSHQEYLCVITNNKQNHHSENIQLKKDKKMLTQQLAHAHITINVLTLRYNEFVKKQPIVDLLGMNDMDV